MQIFGFTPLHHAANNGHLAIVELLIDRKADINARAEQYFK